MYYIRTRALLRSRGNARECVPFNDFVSACLLLTCLHVLFGARADQLFGTRNERNSIRNIEVNVPSREVSKATGMYSSRLRKEGRKEGRHQREAAGETVAT